MKLYKETNVYDEAKKRLRYIFDEFDEVIAGCSSGKDSTVTLELALEVAKEKGKLPLKVLFLDQEIEWQATIDYIKDLKNRPEIDLRWYQIPFKETQAVNGKDAYLYCWEEGNEENWVREKEPDTIHENIYGSDRFAELFEKIVAVEYPDKSVAYVSGVRAEESPARSMGLTQGNTYKGITWGKTLNSKRGHYTFYPLYDWSYLDIWKAIHDNDWAYNKVYDYQYRYGLPVQEMRVSSLTHETAIKSLFYLQEVEPETYEAAVKRLGGIDTAGKMGGQGDFYIKDLPYMFKDWWEYRDYLVDNLLLEDQRERFHEKFKKMDDLYKEDIGEGLARVQINSILTQDTAFTKLDNWERAGAAYAVRGRKGISKYHYEREGNKK